MFGSTQESDVAGGKPPVIRVVQDTQAGDYTSERLRDIAQAAAPVPTESVTDGHEPTRTEAGEWKCRVCGWVRLSYAAAHDCCCPSSADYIEAGESEGYSEGSYCAHCGADEGYLTYCGHCADHVQCSYCGHCSESAVTKWTCEGCGEVHYDEDDAATCCQAYLCRTCGYSFPSLDEANEHWDENHMPKEAI